MQNDAHTAPVCRCITRSSPAGLPEPPLPGKLFGRVHRAEPLDLAAICGVADRVGDVARLRRGAGGPQKGLLWAVGGGPREPDGSPVAARGAKLRVLAGLAGPEPLATSRRCYPRCGGRAEAHRGEGPV